MAPGPGGPPSERSSLVLLLLTADEAIDELFALLPQEKGVTSALPCSSRFFSPVQGADGGKKGFQPFYDSAGKKTYWGCTGDMVHISGLSFFGQML